MQQEVQKWELSSWLAEWSMMPSNQGLNPGCTDIGSLDGLIEHLLNKNKLNCIGNFV